MGLTSGFLHIRVVSRKSRNFRDASSGIEIPDDFCDEEGNLCIINAANYAKIFHIDAIISSEIAVVIISCDCHPTRSSQVLTSFLFNDTFT